MRTWLLVTSFALSLPLAACGDDTGGAGGGGTGGGSGGSDATTSTTTTGGTTTTGTTTTTSTTGAGGAPGSVTVVSCDGTIAAEIVTDGFAFSPTTVDISAGEIIRFTPASSAHNIAGDGWSSEFGATTCFAFAEPGAFDFVCDAHATMTGTVNVE